MNVDRRGLPCKLALLLSGGLLLAAITPAYALTGNPARGRQLSFFCQGCHGIKGWRNAYPPYSEPKLAGQQPDYIVNALKEYKSGARVHPTMHAIASSLSDQDMADLAAYFAQLGKKGEQ